MVNSVRDARPRTVQRKEGGFLRPFITNLILQLGIAIFQFQVRV